MTVMNKHQILEFINHQVPKVKHLEKVQVIRLIENLHNLEELDLELAKIVMPLA